jgi:hypothetical protein
MKLESVSYELKTIRGLFEQVDPADVSGTLEKYGIILCLFDLITRRVRQERDPKNYNEMFNGKNLSLHYFEEKLELFVQQFGYHVHGHPGEQDWLRAARGNLEKVFHQLAPFE